MELQYHMRVSPSRLRAHSEKDLEIIWTWRNQEDIHKWFINSKINNGNIKCKKEGIIWKI